MRCWFSVLSCSMVGGLVLSGCASNGSPADGSTMAQPGFNAIDATLFDARGRVERAIVTERVMPAPVGEVFETFTNGAAMTETVGVQSNIDFRIGGEFGLWFAPDAPEGERGSENCQILSYLPDRMLSFTWNAPPTIPDARGRRSWVVVEFEPLGDHWSRVRLTHTGFGEGEAWDATHAYFEKAWPGFLDAMQRGFASRTSLDSDLSSLAFMIGTWRGIAPGGGMAEGVFGPSHNDSMLASFRWTPPSGDALVLELSTLRQDSTGVYFNIRHFDHALRPWDSEAEGPMRLRLSEIDFGRAVFVPVELDSGIDALAYELVNDTLVATVAQRGDETPLVLRLSRVP